MEEDRRSKQRDRQSESNSQRCSIRQRPQPLESFDMRGGEDTGLQALPENPWKYLNQKATFGSEIRRASKYYLHLDKARNLSSYSRKPIKAASPTPRKHQTQSIRQCPSSKRREARLIADLEVVISLSDLEGLEREELGLH